MRSCSVVASLGLVGTNYMKYAILLFVGILFFAGTAQAYVGPGLGVGVIGAIIGVLLAIVMAIVGVFWYPLKRLFNKKENSESLEEDDENEQSKKNDSKSISEETTTDGVDKV